MISIRPVSLGDDAQVRDLILSIAEKEFPAEERAFLSTDIENVSKQYAKEGETFFVACKDKKIVGTVGIKREDERNALLRRIFVSPDFRGMKIGFQLIQKAIEFCGEQGYEEIIFKTTSRMKEAISLCEANGFVRRASINLGGMDLFKYTKFLPTNSNTEEKRNPHVIIPEKKKRRSA